MAADSDDELLERARHEPEAFGLFYRRNESSVLGYFMRRVNDAERAADLTAETFAAALISVPKFRRQREPATAWLFGIARHKLLRSLERQRIDDRARRKLGLDPLELSDDACEAIERLGADQRADQLLESLPADQASAIRARVIDETDYGEIARTMRCSPNVVRKRVSRGLATLRSTLENTQ